MAFIGADVNVAGIVPGVERQPSKSLPFRVCAFIPFAAFADMVKRLSVDAFALLSGHGVTS